MPSHQCNTSQSMSAPDKDDVMVIDISQSQEVLLTQLLQAAATDCEAECEQCHNNGNKSPQEDKLGGKNLDQTCLQLAIEWPATMKASNATTHYWCITCDKFWPNNSHSRALDHCDVSLVEIYFHLTNIIGACRVLKQDWLTLAKEVEAELLKSSGDAVASGQGTAPKVRARKKKAYMETDDDMTVQATCLINLNHHHHHNHHAATTPTTTQPP